MHQRKGKKILIYFFLLISVGSINNIDLSSLKFKNINNVSVVGLENDKNLIIIKEIRDLDLKNIFSLNPKKINDVISSNSLIEKYEVFKRYPSSLDINIAKTKFLAKINNYEKIFLIGSNGKLSKDDLFNNHLPFIFGQPNSEEFLNFKKIIDQSIFSYDEIKNFYFFPSKRWDIELKNNIIIKLPKDNTKDSLEVVFKFLDNQNLKRIKIIDARIKDQIIIND
jgi:cell division protein FtsQ